jgi:hypothetical protein
MEACRYRVGHLDELVMQAICAERESKEILFVVR